MIFFVNLGPRLSSYIPDSNNNFETYLKEPSKENFAFENITPEIILETVSKLKPKNSSGYISTKLLKEIVDSFFFLQLIFLTFLLKQNISSNK